MRKLAIIILNYNSWRLTIDFIDNQLAKQKLPVNTKIVVVDNNSNNDSFKRLLAAKDGRDYILLSSKGNNGYASGNNIGLKWAHDHGFFYGLVANTDVIFKKSDTIKVMLSVFNKDNRIGVVSPRVFTPNGMETNRNLIRPSVYDLTFGKVSYRIKGRKVPKILVGKDVSYCYNYRPQGCCMLVDLEKMATINYMDEYTFLYMEEPILAERFILRGIKGACCLKAKVVHNHSTTVANFAKQKQIYRWQKNSEMYYYKKYRHFNNFQVWLCTSFTALFFMTIRNFKKFN